MKFHWMGLAAVALLASCVAATPEAVEYLQGALDDGVLTQAELDRLQILLNKPASVWKDVGYTALTIAGALLGVRLTPNRLLLGRLTETHHGPRTTHRNDPSSDRRPRHLNPSSPGPGGRAQSRR